MTDPKNTMTMFVDALLSTSWDRNAFLASFAHLANKGDVIKKAAAKVREAYCQDEAAKDGLARIAYLLWGEGKRNEARRLWEEDLDLGRASWWQCLRYADGFVETDEVTKAMAIVQRVYDKFPDAMSGYAGLGWRIRLRDPKRAKSLFRKDAQEGRVSAEFLGKFAIFFAQQEEFEESSNIAAEALAMDPQSRVIHQIAEIFQVKGRFDKVVDLYRDAPIENWFKHDQGDDHAGDTKDADNLFAFYDLLGMAPTFDAIAFLGHAERIRDQQNLVGIKIVIVPATPQRFPLWYPVDQRGQAWRFQNIVLPLCGMLPTCTGIAICGTRDEAKEIERRAIHVFPEDYRVSRPTQDFYFLSRTTGEYPSRFIRPSETASGPLGQRLEAIAKGRKAVVITLREANVVSKQRNSNADDWLRFVRGLDTDRYLPIVVRDQDKAFSHDEEWLPFQQFPEVAWNLELRAALYEAAYLNLGVANGPMAFCLANSSTRMLMFKNACTDAVETSRELMAKNGFEVGKQPSFVTKYQKFVWEDDTYDVIQREFDEMVELIERNGETK